MEASSTAARTEATPYRTAFRVTKRLVVVLAMTRASVVLPVPGGPEKITLDKLVLLYGPAQEPAGAHDVVLADELVQGPRPHARGQGFPAAFRSREERAVGAHLTRGSSRSMRRRCRCWTRARP